MSRAGLWGLSTLTATLLSACFFPEVDLEGRACAVNEDCLADYVCESSLCVQPASSTDDAGAPVDAGSDAGSADSGTLDAGPVDAGLVDAGLEDAGLVDAGLDDADANDAGPEQVEIPTDALILHLPFNGDHDDVANNIAVSFSGAEDYAGDRFGLAERALTMHESGDSGSQALVSTATLGNRGFTQSFSLAIWLKVYDGFTLNDGTRIAGEGDFFNLYADNGRIFWGLWSTATSDPTEVQLQGPTLTTGWKLYVGVVEEIGADSQLRLYADGQLAAEQTVTGRTYLNPTDCRFYIGNLPDNGCTTSQADGSSSLPALVDDVRVYARALSAAEVLALFNEEAP